MFEPTEEQRRLIEIKKEIREEMRRQKKEDARRELWEGFDADALLTDALEAQRRARESVAFRELRKRSSRSDRPLICLPERLSQLR